MKINTPLRTIEALIEARKHKDLPGAFACYDTNATIVLQPGQTGSGAEVIKAFIEQASALAITFGGHQIVESGDIALHLSSYTLDLGEHGTVVGRTADVLCKQTDGSWLIVIDNAWAGSELTKAE